MKEAVLTRVRTTRADAQMLIEMLDEIETVGMEDSELKHALSAAYRMAETIRWQMELAIEVNSEKYECDKALVEYLYDAKYGEKAKDESGGEYGQTE